MWMKTGTLFSYLDLFLTFFLFYAFHYHLLFYLDIDRPTVLLLQNPLFRSYALHALWHYFILVFRYSAYTNVFIIKVENLVNELLF